ncbi:hypothetical protein ACFLTU_03650 [Bacteroidota bacterium]
MRSLSIICVAIILFSFQGIAQIFEQPIYSLTSHPTLDIISVERWEDQMVLNLSLKNERYSGSFCIDPNTVLKNSLGDDEYKLLSMDGIPSCPDTYRFKSVGERIAFSLIFQAVPDEVTYIDLLENCDENCVSLKYILLDEDLNSRLVQGIRLYELGKPQASLQVFEDIMSTEYDGLSPVFGTVYLYLISIHYELGSSKDARRVYQDLQESNIFGKEEFIETAKETGIVR